MAVLYLFIFILVFFITYTQFGSLLRLNFIYTTLWCLGGLLVSLNYSGFYDISFSTHLYIVLSIIVFNIAYFLKVRKYVRFFSPIWDLNKLRYQLLVLFHIISYIFMIPIMYRAIQLIIGLGWSSLRAYAYTESSLLSSSQLMVYSWIINPIFSATFLITAVLFISGSKYKKSLLIMSIIDLLMITISFGGRNGIVKIASFVVIAFLMKGSMEGKKNKIKLKYIVAICLVVLLLAFLTSLRSMPGLSFIQNVLVYLFGSIVYFDLIIQPGYSNLNSIKLFGNATFGVFTSIPMYFFYRLTGTNLVPDYLIDQTTNNSLYISSTFRYNALTTWLFPFWKDAGVLGIIVGVAFITLLFMMLKKKVYYHRKMSTYTILIYITYVVCTSTMTYNFMTIQHCVIIIMLLFFTKNACLCIQNYDEELK